MRQGYIICGTIAQLCVGLSMKRWLCGVYKNRLEPILQPTSSAIKQFALKTHCSSLSPTYFQAWVEVGRICNS